MTKEDLDICERSDNEHVPSSRDRTQSNRTCNTPSIPSALTSSSSSPGTELPTSPTHLALTFLMNIQLFASTRLPFVLEILQPAAQGHLSEAIYQLNDDLSSLCLPTVFYASEQLSTRNIDEVNLLDPSPTPSSKTQQMTVSRYISKINENILVDFMFSCEMRYANNVLRIMRHLIPKLCQPFLIYELDFQLTSFFRYIRWKMLNFYLVHTVRVRRLIQRMLGIINLGVRSPEHVHRGASVFRLLLDHRLSRYQRYSRPNVAKHSSRHSEEYPRVT